MELVSVRRKEGRKERRKERNEGREAMAFSVARARAYETGLVPR